VAFMPSLFFISPAENTDWTGTIGKPRNTRITRKECGGLTTEHSGNYFDRELREWARIKNGKLNGRINPMCRKSRFTPQWIFTPHDLDEITQRRWPFPFCGFCAF